MANAQVQRGCSGPGFSLSRSVSVEFEHNNSFEIALPGGKAVTGWTKTDSNTASCTLAAGHGQTNGKYDVYWTIDSVDYVRYGVDGTISTNTLSLDGGSGDSFPESGQSGVVCTKQVSVNNVLISAAKLQIIAFLLETTLSTARAHVDMQESDDTQVEHFTVEVVADGSVGKPSADHIYAIADGDANPLGADVAKIYASNGTTTAATLKILVGEEL